MEENNTNTNTNTNTNATTDSNTQNASQLSRMSSTLDNTNNDSNASQTAQNESQKESQNDNVRPNIEELIQKAVDRATNKLGNDNKKLREQLDTLKKNKLTDDERRQLEIADKEADIADREARLQERENRLFAIKAIKDAGLDDGSTNALELVDFVMTDNEETTVARVKAFEDLVNKFVSAKVSQTFKDNGRNPDKGGSTSAKPQNDIAINIGKTMADRNAAAKNVLNHYLGGK